MFILEELEKNYNIVYVWKYLMIKKKCYVLSIKKIWDLF